MWCSSPALYSAPAVLLNITYVWCLLRSVLQLFLCSIEEAVLRWPHQTLEFPQVLRIEGAGQGWGVTWVLETHKVLLSVKVSDSFLLFPGRWVFGWSWKEDGSQRLYHLPSVYVLKVLSLVTTYVLWANTKTRASLMVKGTKQHSEPYLMLDDSFSYEDITSSNWDSWNKREKCRLPGQTGVGWSAGSNLWILLNLEGSLISTELRGGTRKGKRQQETQREITETNWIFCIFKWLKITGRLTIDISVKDKAHRGPAKNR